MFKELDRQVIEAPRGKTQVGVIAICAPLHVINTTPPIQTQAATGTEDLAAKRLTGAMLTRRKRNGPLTMSPQDPEDVGSAFLS